MGAQNRKRRRVVVAEVPTDTTAHNGAPLMSVPLAREVILERDVLRRALTRMTHLVDKRSTLPILSHVAIRTDGATVDIVGTDLGVWLTIHIASGKPSERSGMTIPAHKLSALVRTLPTGHDVALRPMDTHAEVICGTVRSRIEMASDRDYPAIPDIGDTPMSSVDGKAWRAAIDSVVTAVCKDTTRSHLNGAYMECDGATLSVTATDGHRLSRARFPWRGPVIPGVIIPSEGLDALHLFLRGECSVGLSEHVMFVRSGDDTLAIRLRDAQFPPYAQVIPTGHTRLVTLHREGLAAALERAKLLCTPYRGVKLEVVDGALTLSADSPDSGSIREEIHGEANPGAWFVGVNPWLLLDALDALDCETVTIGGDGELSPILVRSTEDAVMRPVLDASHLTVIMPMRL